MDAPPPRFEPGVAPPAESATAGGGATASPRARWFLVRDGKFLVAADGSPPDAIPPGLEVVESHYLGALDGGPCWVACVAAGAALPAGYTAAGLRSFWGRWDEATLAVAGRAAQVAHWDATHRFCGRCGAPTTTAAGERAKQCARCGFKAWPRVAPCVIVRIDRGDELLLARNASFPMPFFSVLAGFVDPGETLEEAIAREVREEVGVRVADVRYFASEPWPFPHSLMIAFTARWVAGEIAIDDKEIAEARWFPFDALPMVPPTVSIAGRLIRAFADARSRRAETRARVAGLAMQRAVATKDGRAAAVRPAREGDAADLHAAERAIVDAGVGVVMAPEDLPADEAATRADIARWAASGADGALFVAELDGRVVGSASVRRLRPRGVRHVAQLAVGVAPAAQGLGLGRALVEQCLAWAMAGDGRGVTRVDLTVMADNARAVALYESLGFEREGLRVGYVRGGDGAVHDDAVMSFAVA